MSKDSFNYGKIYKKEKNMKDLNMKSESLGEWEDWEIKRYKKYVYTHAIGGMS